MTLTRTTLSSLLYPSVNFGALRQLGLRPSSFSCFSCFSPPAPGFKDSRFLHCLGARKSDNQSNSQLEQLVIRPGFRNFSTEEVRGRRSRLGAEVASSSASASEMPVKPAVELSSIGEGKLKSFMDNVDAVMFDCDGVLWLGNDPIKNAQALVIKLRAMGKKVFFMTNNSTRTRAEFLDKFNTLGFETAEEEIVSTAYLTALYLKELGFKRKVYVIGSAGITQELSAVGIESFGVGPDTVPPNSERWKSDDFLNVEMDPDVGAVIVGFDHHFSYKKALKAASYLAHKNSFGEERLFIATNTDEQFPGRGECKLVFPGTGTFVSAVKTCAGQEPIIIGKPEVFPFQLIQKQYKLDPRRVLMVGDRGNTDILFGKKCGLWTLLVMSGVTTIGQMHSWEQSQILEEQLCVPDYHSKDVDEFYQLILKI